MRSSGALTITYALLCAGCGKAPSAAPDGGVDAGAADLAERPDLTAIATGTRLAEGKLGLLGLTTEGWLVYEDVTDPMAATVKAVPIAGGAPQTIVANVGAAFVLDKLVFTWRNLDSADIGLLEVWRPGGAAKEIAKRAPVVAAANRDGTQIAYYVAADAQTGDLVVDKPDHSAPRVLSAKLGLGDNECSPLVDFVGARIVATRCTTDGKPPTITSYDATGKGVDLLANASPSWSFDPAGKMILAVDQAGTGAVLPVAGGAPLLAGLTSFWSGRFTHDGAGILYVTETDDLIRRTIQGGAAALLQSGVADYWALSLDDKFVVYNQDSDTWTDLYLASAVAPGPAITLSAEKTAATNDAFGNTFTEDSSRAMFFTEVDDTDEVGTFRVLPVTGGTPATLATRSGYVLRGKGTRAVFDANLGVGPDGPVADILTADTAKADPPTMIATRASVFFYVTPDRRSVIYSAPLAADPGIYIAPLP